MLKRKKGINIICLSLGIILFLTVTCLFSACNSRETPSEVSQSDEVGADEQSVMTITEADRIRFFHISSLTLPEDFDPKNNLILNELAKMANVEFTEVILPPYADYQTRFNLMMSSGDIPDVVHYTSYNELNKYGMEGAFIELTDIISESSIMQKRYSDVIEQLKAIDGKIYCLRSQPMDGDSGTCFFVRYDLLKEAGYTDIPETLEEWIEAMRKVKEMHPDSYPYITRLNWADFILQSYGCGSGYGWQYYFGKVQNVFENPLYKDALATYRSVYQEGLIDPEFVTYSSTDYENKRMHNNCLINIQNLGAITTRLQRYTINKVKGAVIIPCQWPKLDDERIDPYTVYSGYPTLGSHCFAISSSSTKKDAVVRFIETLLSDEAKQLGDWGREGIEFNIVNGEKVLDYEKSDALSWRGIYNTLFVNNKERIQILADTYINNTEYDENFKKSYKDLYFKQYNKILNENFSLPTNPVSFITLSPDTLSRLTEANNEAQTLAIRAMIGEISYEEFENQAINFVQKYKSITEEYNQKLPEAKRIAGSK